MKSIKGTITFLFMCTLLVSFVFSNGAEVQRKLSLELKASALNSSDKATQGAMKIAKGNEIINKLKAKPISISKAVSITRECVDTDNGATDPYGDGCAAYAGSPSWCGLFDDDDFLSMEMCCACGGGQDDGAGGGGCVEGEFTCADGGCILAGYFCDGSSTADPPTAGWGPDCADGSDEGWDICDGQGPYQANPGCADTDCGYFLANGYDCATLDYYGYDCTACADEGACDAPTECDPDTQFTCGDGSCISAGWYCDGSTDNGNGSWPADCADGSDELADDCCADGTFSAYDDAFCNGGGGNNDGLCFDDADYNYDLDGDGYVDDASTCGYYVLYQGMSCEDIEYYGIDCTAVADCGGCVVDACSEAGGSPTWVGDGYCDGANNNDACGFDGGDCCACDCVSGTYDCDLYGGGDCQNPAGNDGDVECWDGSMVCDALDCSEQPGGCDDGFTGYLMNCGGGSWESEVSWTLSDGTAGGAPYSETACLADGDYTLSMVDSYGDSWSGNTWTLTNDAGDLFASCGLDGVNDDGAAGDCSFTLGATAPVVGCMDVEACNYDETATIEAECFMNDCAGECGGEAVEDCAGECGGAALADDCGECNGDGTACASCAFPTWYDDNYCDASNNTPECGYDGGDCCPGDCLVGGANNPGSYDCATDGGDCTDCLDPNSADNTPPDGQCYAETADAPANVGCGGDWSVTNGPEIVLTWDASADAESYEVFYFFETCEDQGLVTCLDGSCEATDADCPAATCGDIGGNEGWLGDGYCDSINNNDTCGFDGGDCCASTCVDADYACDASTGPCAVADCQDPNGNNDDCGVLGCVDTTCGYYLNYGYTCDDLAYYGIDCTACADEGACGGGTTGCDPDTEFTCADGGCIPASYYCDGSIDNGNAGWGPDCADGSDEVMTECCDNGSYDAADCGGGTGGGAQACADAGGFYCGDDSANWTSYSPEGCVPANYICDGWEDCVDASDEVGCGGVSNIGTASEKLEFFIDMKRNIETNNQVVIPVLAKMQNENVYYMNILNNVGLTTNTTREWLSLGTTTETTMTVVSVDCETAYSFGVTAINMGGSSEMTLVDGCIGGCEPTTTGLFAMENFTATGECDDYDGDGVEDSAVSWTWTDPNEPDPFEPCLDGSEPMVDCIGTLFCNAEPPWTGYDCIVGCENSTLGDSYCDDGTWGFDFQCEEYSNDCGDCDGDNMGDVNGYCGGTTPTGCAEGEWECADGGCIPASYYCDGSIDNGNASWGPDCADGSDEVMTECCDNGSYDAADCDGGTGGGAQACTDAGGFYCGDDPANWTSYSPEGCVPANYICDGWEDCVDASDEAGCAAVGCAESTCGYYLNYGYTCDDLAYDGIDCGACAEEGACGGGVVINEGNGTASEKLEFFNDVKEERAELYSNRRSPFNLVSPPMIVDVDGNVLLNPTPTNRTISYEIHASCETCLDGGPWENTYTSATSEFLVYGFDEGNSACAEVRALSDLSNELSPWSDTVCANAGCGPDCVAGDANGDLSVNVSDIVILVNVILNLGGATDGVECADMNGDASITVTDIVAIIQIILNPMANADAEATDAQLNLGSDVTLTSNGQISAIQMVLSHDSNFSLELTQDAWVADYATTDNKTTLIVVMPSSDFVFTPNGEFTIEETIVLSSTNEIDVTVNAIPVDFSVSNAYPNPFNPVTAINISLPSDDMVNVSVYNVAGQMVDAVFNNSLTAGSHSITWDAGNLSSGVYLIRTEAGKNISTQKVMLLK